jgi:hypothetical protein
LDVTIPENVALLVFSEGYFPLDVPAVAFSVEIFGHD